MPFSKKNIVFFFLLFGSPLFAQTYNFKNYNTEQGLPQSQVLSIFQDHSGNMWFGTNSGGVGKYDGNKFTTISDNDGLINNVVFSIAENSKNELVFGTSKGLSVFNGFTYKNYNEKNGLKNSWIFKLLKDEDKIWIGTQEGVYILQNEKIRRFQFDSILDKASVFSIFIDSQKRMWFATINDGAICYNPANSSFTHFDKSNGLQGTFVFSIGETASKEILIGTVNGLNVIDTKNNVRVGDYIPRQFYIAFRSILVTSKNEQLFGSADIGLLKYHNYSLLRYNLSNGLTFNSIMCLFEDRENNIWMGTDGSGVYKYSGDRFVYYSKQDGLPENYVNAVIQDKKGDYWVALRNAGISRIRGASVENYKFDKKNINAIPDNDINAILAAEDGKIYFGTRDGLCVYENGKFNTISDFGFRHQYILSLFQDSKKIIWIGTNNGLFKLQNGVITEATAVNALKQTDIPFPVFCMREDKQGALWVGTENGVVKYDKENITLFSDKNNFTNRRISNIIKDYKQNLWFGTEEGLFHYDYSTFTKISQRNGLTSNFINFSQTDDLQRLFIGTNTGIDILDLKDFYNKKITIKHFGKEDGLISVESNSNASFKDKDGRILIGTINGLEIYDPRFDKKNTKEALTKINNVKLFFGQEDLSKYTNGLDSTSLLPKNLNLPFNKNHVTFHFIGVSLTAPEKVMYQYKLEGLENDSWTPPTSKTEATFSSLPPGHYKFMVKAMNNDGLWNTEPVSYEFIISPPWYKTWWFYTLSAITLIAGIWLYNSMRTKKLIADKQKLELQVTERTKELREEKEKVEIINKEVIEQKTVIEHHNIEITDSIKYAKNIQEALLPNLSEIGNLFQNSFVLYMPKDIVSGDFYWFARNGDTRFIAAVDCTGHGVPGAFMSIVGNTLLNEIVNEKKITAPGDILLELHKGVKIALNQNAKEFERRDGMDITLCAFNSNAGEIQYAGANRPLWIYRKDKGYELEIIKATKYPIGGLELEESRVYQNHVVPVNEGDCLYLFSDGYADQFGGPKGKKFMLTNLQRTLLENVESPMEVQKQKLMDAFMDWKDEAEQIDDVLVIGIRI
ncbi:MAG: Response regulator containing a CheY-like receiver domain and a domain protein [Bacteroidetes bacterium]|jgi:ligand-binding sensor domain-containing protein/serine phosphatase RsbU (regulator of sigma subunit)|nr:Response regulator containing a CheY-like receiver domain and a domain protein [Bacteroidota bacterium]MDF2452278.1 Response regulator containing a CheY-like receiver domain and a domain protein [Bacteroidota bacterium]